VAAAVVGKLESTMKTTINPSPSLIEALETRRLMSVSMQQDGVVVVTGTDGDDNVQIFANAIGSQPVLTIEVWTADGGEVVNLPLGAVSGVQVDGLAGNDRLFVDRTYDPHMAVPVTLFGGAGDDVLIGGAGQDVLDGGDGGNVVIAIAARNDVSQAKVVGKRWVAKHARTVKGRTVLTHSGEKHRLPRATVARLKLDATR